ncbi:uncharacterized protein LOC122575527 isoform X2 [Bombus pyrosoma]|uniref:uncharacterized protein LOC122575527 isoform X2 n=1 Tax=Bombus pyrosoma TaxID=396416 RepID=UPI001CB9C838|nr:uncharacterized protein LOC122575527 isoform X2 [Bombus pyrosoma]
MQRGQKILRAISPVDCVERVVSTEIHKSLRQRSGATRRPDRHREPDSRQADGHQTETMHAFDERRFDCEKLHGDFVFIKPPIKTSSTYRFARWLTLPVWPNITEKPLPLHQSICILRFLDTV